MAIIFNKVDNVNEIQILGDIGEGWFSEGVTAQSIANQVNQMDGDLTVLLKSSGGDLSDGLAIYDMLTSYNKGKVTTKIIGANASSAMVIALAGHTTMSDNALGLNHFSSTWTGGNAKDHEKSIQQLNAFDARLINIYAKKSKKSKSEVTQLLDDGEWKSAEELKEFGLVDEIFNGPKIKNSVIEKINNSNILPKIKNMAEPEKDTFFDRIKNLFEKDQTELTTRVKNAEEKAAAAVLTEQGKDAKIADIEAKLTEKDAKIAELEAGKTAIENKVTEITNQKVALETELSRKGLTIKNTAGGDPVITVPKDPGVKNELLASSIEVVKNNVDLKPLKIKK